VKGSGPKLNLLLLALGAVALLLVLILVFRMHAFLAMMLSAFALGLAAGMPPAGILKSIQAGFGDALGFIAVVLGLGAMIGAYLEHSGGGIALADWLIDKFGRKNSAWAMLLAGFLVGLPIFFEVGFIILVPLVYSLTREGKRPLLVYGLAMTAPLTVLHSLVPPHPAPAAAAQLLGADLGHCILYGVLLAIPMSLISGMGYGQWIATKIDVPLPAAALEAQSAIGCSGDVTADSAGAADSGCDAGAEESGADPAGASVFGAAGDADRGDDFSGFGARAGARSDYQPGQ